MNLDRVVVKEGDGVRSVDSEAANIARPLKRASARLSRFVDEDTERCSTCVAREQELVRADACYCWSMVSLDVLCDFFSRLV